MNGPHDLGGQHGFGPVRPEADEPVFHAEWERRALGLTLAMGATGAWTIDMSRHARERTPPAAYLAASYYEIWLAGLQRLLLETGLVTPAEIEAGRAHSPAAPLPRRPTAGEVPALLARGAPAIRTAAAPALYRPGEAVRTRLMNPLGHTRLPRYARDRTGRVEAVRGAHVFPDSNAHGGGESPQWLYSVSFDAQELWGSEASPGDTVALDLWEPYLERA